MKFKNIKFQIVCPTGTMYEYPKDIFVDHSLVDMEQDFLTPKIIYENFNNLSFFKSIFSTYKTKKIQINF